MTRRWYPLLLDLEGRVAVIAGGGAVAARKAEALRGYGARVIVVAPQISDALRALDVELRERAYEPHDLDEASLVVAATDDPWVNERVARDARERRILVNVADASSPSDFIVPAVIERGSIQLAISTGGHSPALARRIKADLQQFLGDHYAEVAKLLGRLRESARTSPQLPHDADRKRFFDELLDRGIVELLRDGRRDEAYAIVREACAAAGIDVTL